jgi:hypothetical protein
VGNAHEAAVVLWIPAFWSLEAEAGRVEDGEDRNRHARVRELCAASAAVVSSLGNEVVFHGEVLCVTSRLETTSQKLIL